MRLKTKPRRAADERIIALNRSKKLEGLRGKYDGRDIKSRYVRLPEVRQQ